MDYLEWCERVLSIYLQGARGSLEVRSSGLRPEQVARAVFGPEVVEHPDFDKSTRNQGLRQAIRDLDDEGLILTDDDLHGDEQKTPGKIIDDGEQFLEDEGKRWTAWWATCAAAPELKTQHSDLLELVIQLNPG